jgi:uncharacterized protein (TIGR04255 family)
MPTPLPEFGNPPVCEVALSVQFDRLTSIGVPQLGILWQAFRARFPRTEEHAVLDSTIEQFGPRHAGRSGVKLELMSVPPVPRVWLLNDSGTELIQLQQDRFVRNWRRKGDADPYPRYRQLRESFQEDFSTFRRLVDDERWGQVAPNQCEVTYVNLIPAGEGWRDHGELENVLTIFSAKYSDNHLAKPEEAAVNATYVLNDSDGNTTGRLYIAANPVRRLSDNLAAIRLTLTARGRPEGGGIDGVMQSLDRGRDAIVRGFASITTPTMHQIWRRTQ